MSNADPNKGTTAAPGLSPSELQAALRQLGDENIVPRGLGDGVMKDGEDMGRQDRVYAIVPLPQPAPATVEVAHKLGRVPAFVRLLTIISPEGATPPPHASIAPHQYNKWTATTLRLDVVALAGSLDNCQLYLEVGGTRG